MVDSGVGAAGQNSQGGVWRRVAAGGGLLIVLLTLVLGDVSASLGRIEVPELPARSMASVRSVFNPAESTAHARQAWCLWNGYRRTPVVVVPPDPGSATSSSPLPASAAADCTKAFSNDEVDATVAGDGTGGILVASFVLLDSALIVLYLGLSLTFVMRRRRKMIGEQQNGSRDVLDDGLIRATGFWPLLLLFGGLLATELVEGLAQVVLGRDEADEDLVDAAGWVLAVAPGLKSVWQAVLLLLLVLLVARPYVRQRRGEGLAVTADGVRLRRQAFKAVGILRLQMVTAGLFVLLLAGVGQDQVADALLRWGDLNGGLRGLSLGLGTVLLGLATVTMFCLLLWRSAHRAAFTVETARKPPRLCIVAGAAVACLVVGIAWRNLMGLGVCLAVLALLSTFAGAPFWREEIIAAEGSGNAPPEGTTSEGPNDSGYRAARRAATRRASALEDPLRGRVARLGRWIAAVPLVALGSALVRTALPPMLVRGTVDLLSLGALVALGIGLLGVGVATPSLLAREDRRLLDPGKDETRSHRLYWTLAVVASVAALLAFAPRSRHWFPVLVGPVGVAALFFALLLVLGNEVQRQAEWTIPLAGLRVLGVRRNPVLALIVAWFVVGSLLDTNGHHDVRTPEDERQAAGQLSVQTAFQAWLRANCAVGSGTSASPDDVPMVFVAAQGGGIRAAYWTAGVLESLFPADGEPVNGECAATARNRVFAASGASGGSVGITAWLNAPDAAAPWYQREVSATDPSWFDKALAVDHLSALASWMLYVDAPRSLIGFGGPDRAAILEESWEKSQPAMAEGFLSSYAELETAPGFGQPWRPLALLNGTAVESGCRALTAPIQLTDLDTGSGPTAASCRRVPSTAGDADRADATGLYDLTAIFLCEHRDINMSTASLLSARFPYVTPSGRLTRCGEGTVHTNVVDGGYLDNSGAMTATDIYQRLRSLIKAHNDAVTRCSTGCDDIAADERPTGTVRPVFVQVDNGYSSVAALGDSGRPRELLVPPATRLAVAATVEQAARQRSFTTFGSKAFYRIANSPHPGVQAPLGWALSDSARDELCNELGDASDDMSFLATDLGLATPTARTC